MANKSAQKKATLALADGTVFEGYSVGVDGETGGEVVFNTSMSGYQEILTDPSYAFQMLTFTYPHIGNVGVNKDDVESNKVHVAGFISREFCEHPSNYRAEKTLREYLVENNVVGIAGIDTSPPIDAPELNNPWAKARSLVGNHSAFPLAAPGQLPASATPRIARKNIKLPIPRAKACNAVAIDQTPIERAKPIRVPTQSKIFPKIA